MTGRDGPDPVNQLLLSLFLTVAILTIVLLGLWVVLR
jgi:hypothetical protein